MTTSDTSIPTPIESHYADVDGLHLYYETQGTGRPLILLHGGLGSGEMFGPFRPACRRPPDDRTRPAGPRPNRRHRSAVDVRLMADDIAALIRYLGLDRPDVVGYSLGGGVAFMTAVESPELVRKLVVASAHVTYDALDPADVRPAGAGRSRSRRRGSRAPRCTRATSRVAPNPEDFPRLLDKIGASMKKPFDFSEEVRGLQVPTMFVAADADMAPPSHYVEVFKLLDGGLRDGGWMGEGRPKGGHALAILPGLTHYNLGISPLFATVTQSFLDAASHAATRG